MTKKDAQTFHLQDEGNIRSIFIFLVYTIEDQKILKAIDIPGYSDIRFDYVT